MKEKTKIRKYIPVLLFFCVIQGLLLAFQNFYTYFLAVMLLGDFFFMFFRDKVEFFVDERVHAKYELTTNPFRLQFLLFLAYILVSSLSAFFLLTQGEAIGKGTVMLVIYLSGLSVPFFENLVPYNSWSVVTENSIILGCGRVFPRITKTILISSVESIERRVTIYTNFLLNLKSGKHIALNLNKQAEELLRVEMGRG